MESPLPEVFTETLIVWWRYGKEHGSDQLRVNPQALIDERLAEKVARFRTQAQQDRQAGQPWRWWQVDPDLIIERPPPRDTLFGENGRIYYLLRRGLAVIENVHLPPPDDHWNWYVHISDFQYHEALGCWLMKDMFCDIVVENDDHTYHIFDLPDMARALDVGLITPGQSAEILRRLDWAVNRISRREFPFEDIHRARAAAARLGW